MRRSRLLAGTVTAGSIVGLAVPAAVAAHSLNPTYTSRLPLAVYVAGAAATVALSFIFVLVRDVRAERPDTSAPGHLPPAWLRWTLRVIGLVAWTWIVAQGIAGGSSAAEVATLFLLVYGWVGVAGVSALVGPVWQFLDPFSTLLRHRRVDRPPNGHPAVGAGDLPGAPRTMARGGRLRRRRPGSSSCSRPDPTCCSSWSSGTPP